MTSSWLERNIDLKNKHGLHMRPAQRIVEVASKYKSDIRAVKDEMDCNAKSILDMIEFAAHMALSTAMMITRFSSGPAATTRNRRSRRWGCWWMISLGWSDGGS